MVATINGLNTIRDWISSQYDYGAIGNNSTTPAETDASLYKEVWRNPSSSTDETLDKTFTKEFIFSTVEANYAFTQEFGLFNTPSITLDSCESTTGWTTTGGANNITLDTEEYVEGNASISFDMDGLSINGKLSNTSSPINLSSEDAVYDWVYIPLPFQELLEINVYLSTAGTGTDYYKWSYQEATLSDYWNLLKQDLSSPDATLGSTDLTSITTKTVEVIQKVATPKTGFRTDYWRATQPTMLTRDLLPLVEKTDLKELQYEVTLKIDNK